MRCAGYDLRGLGPPTTVSVNGVEIPRRRIAAEMQHHPARSPAAAWIAAARALIVRELLLQEANRLRLIPQPISDENGRRETDEEALIRQLLEQEVRVPHPDPDSCRRYYEQNRRRFRSPDLYEAAHILIAADRRDERKFAVARGRAQQICLQLEQNPNSFAALAQIHSDCPSASQGGNLGQLTRGQTTPEFERALTTLRPGEISREPLETRYGFHIIRLDQRIEGRELPFEQVASRIADYLAARVWQHAHAQYVARLAARATVIGIELPNPASLNVD